MHPRLKDSRMFLRYFSMNKARESSSFQEKQTKIRNQYTVKKTDRESFFILDNNNYRLLICSRLFEESSA